MKTYKILTVLFGVMFLVFACLWTLCQLKKPMDNRPVEDPTSSWDEKSDSPFMNDDGYYEIDSIIVQQAIGIDITFPPKVTITYTKTGPSAPTIRRMSFEQLSLILALLNNNKTVYYSDRKEMISTILPAKK